jgi:hypothetical protein
LRYFCTSAQAVVFCAVKPFRLICLLGLGLPHKENVTRITSLGRV